ncbi:hypothetical protein [Sneathiella sp.]|uniref:hypothetical protein n=1 Tax=Sneathiella sp. TaxID=1964365 RepID=UPI00260C8EBE|nr:hypothetical protein [Sneathiella sp.]MDF2365801.1 hypothetical protein [Sneathiella sp.]
MRKLGILLLGMILFGSFSVAHADSWHSSKHGSVSKGSKGHGSAVYGKGHKQKPDTGRNITYGPQHSKKKYVHKPPSKGQAAHKWPAPKVAYVKPQHKPYYKKPYHKSYRPKYVYVKPVYVPRYYGYHPYRGYYWPFVNVRFVVNLTSRQIEHHHQALYSALDAPVGHVTTWRDGGQSGSIVILRDGYDAYGNLCKQYRQTLTYRGHVTSSVETSCLSQDGYWISV